MEWMPKLALKSDFIQFSRKWLFLKCNVSPAFDVGQLLLWVEQKTLLFDIDNFETVLSH